MNSTMVWRRRLVGDVVRAAYAEGKQIAALEDAIQGFLSAHTSFRNLCEHVGQAPFRPDWPYVEPRWPHEGEVHVLVSNSTPRWHRIVRNVWMWAEWAVRQVSQYEPGRPPHSSTTVVYASQLEHAAHWPLIASREARVNRPPSWPIDLWWERPEQVQHTRAEQFILTCPEYCGRWHPYRETTGGMRRAPLWNLLLVREWSQVGHAAVADVRTYQSPLAGLAVALIANGSGSSAADPYHQMWANWTQHLGPAIAGQTILADVLERLDAGLNQDPDTFWRDFCSAYRWFPYDHVVPNLLIVMGALRQFPQDIPKAIRFVTDRGFDIVGNALIVASLLGSYLGEKAVAPLPMLPATIEQGIRNSIEHTGSPWFGK